eukprot:11209443-Lingulodinium_polyedra.AAC.1
MEYANVRFASRCNCGWSIQPHRSATFCNTLHNDAVESTLRGRNGLQIARSRTPRARHFSGARMEYASVRFASRCSGGW